MTRPNNVWGGDYSVFGFTLLKKVVTFKRPLAVEFGLCYRCRLSSYNRLLVGLWLSFFHIILNGQVGLRTFPSAFEQFLLILECIGLHFSCAFLGIRHLRQVPLKGQEMCTRWTPSYIAYCLISGSSLSPCRALFVFKRFNPARTVFLYHLRLGLILKGSICLGQFR